MKNRAEVNALKMQWKTDSYWDIWNTEGFDQYEQQLYDWQTEIEKRWRDAEVYRIRRIGTISGRAVNIYSSKMTLEEARKAIALVQTPVMADEQKWIEDEEGNKV
jgi:hypothetical protein